MAIFSAQWLAGPGAKPESVLYGGAAVGVHAAHKEVQRRNRQVY